MAGEAKLGSTFTAAVPLLVADNVTAPAIWAEDILAKQYMAQIFAYLCLTWDLVELIHIHIVLL